jgi:hypothetical protein
MEFAFYKTRPNISLGFELDDDSYVEMWSAFKALYGAWADGIEDDELLIDDEPSYLQPIKSYMVHLTLQGVSRGKPSPLINVELGQTFQELKDKWESETSILSSSTAIILNVNYQQIIGLGPRVIPFILRDLAKTRNHWFWALMAISHENPVQDDDAGNITRMTQRWLDWGHRKGYL